MAALDMDGILAIEFTAQTTVTLQNGDSAIVPAFTPRSFAGTISAVGTAQVMRNVTSEAGKPIQCMRIDEVIVMA